MKRYIKSSFGYEDSDWINPDDLDEYEDREIVLEFSSENVEFDDGDLTFVSRKFDDEYDEETGAFVIDSFDLEQYVYDALEPYFPQYNGMYKLSGWVSIPYQIRIPFKGNLRRRDWEEIEPEAEVKDKAIAGEIKFELA